MVSLLLYMVRKIRSNLRRQLRRPQERVSYPSLVGKIPTNQAQENIRETLGARSFMKSKESDPSAGWILLLRMSLSIRIQEMETTLNISAY